MFEQEDSSTEAITTASLVEVASADDRDVVTSERAPTEDLLQSKLRLATTREFDIPSTDSQFPPKALYENAHEVSDTIHYFQDSNGQHKNDDDDDVKGTRLEARQRHASKVPEGVCHEVCDDCSSQEPNRGPAELGLVSQITEGGSDPADHEIASEISVK